MGTIVEVMIKATFNHHYYRRDSDLYRQAEGGAIGLRATGSVARMVMGIFLRKYREVLEQQSVEVHMIRKYVDDILSVVTNLEPGSRWSEGRITRHQEDIEEDMEAGRSRESTTMEVMRSVADSIIPWLDFTAEVSEGPEKTVPCLDSQLWMGSPEPGEKWYGGDRKDMETPGDQWGNGPGTNILYKFYSKPVSNPFTILRRSAMPEGVKVATAVQEVMRRWKNTSMALGKATWEGITVAYMDRLAAMGYGVPWRAKILEKALIGYGRILRKESQGITRRNRKGAETAMKRRFKKMVGSQEWFRVADEEDQEYEVQQYSRLKKRMSKDDRRIESIYFFPYTPEGRLRTRLVQLERDLHSDQRIKFIEYMGRTVQDTMCKKDPWVAPCSREKCLICKSQPGKCMRQGAIYLVECMACKREEKGSYYVGETARTSYDRCLEHVKAMEAMDENSPLVEHALEQHQGATPEVMMKIISFEKSNLQRQAGEYQHMQVYAGKGTLLNRRGEWGQNLPPKLVFEEDIHQNGNGKRGQEQSSGGGGSQSQSRGVDQGARGARDLAQGDPPEKRIRKGKIAPGNQESLGERIRIAPKILTVKEMFREQSIAGMRRTQQDDMCPTPRASESLNPRLKTLDSIDPRGEQTDQLGHKPEEKVPANEARNLYRGVNQELEHQVLNFIPRDQVAETEEDKDRGTSPGATRSESKALEAEGGQSAVLE